MSTAVDESTANPPASRSVRGRAWSVVGAVALPVLIWLVADPLAGLDLVVPQSGNPMTITLFPVVAASAVVSLVGWGALAVLEKFTAAAKTIWTVAAVLVLAVSFMPFLSSAMTTSTMLVLGLMHLVVAGILIPGMRRSPRAV